LAIDDDAQDIRIAKQMQRSIQVSARGMPIPYYNYDRIAASGKYGRVHRV
jgi:hypothetical protein